MAKKDFSLAYLAGANFPFRLRCSLKKTFPARYMKNKGI